MLIKAKSLKGYKLLCTDGEIGEVKEFIFDEQHWTIRYLVAETGNWLMDRQVLISPRSLVSIDKEERQIITKLTVSQIEASPSLYKDIPISRQFESTYHNYYGFPTYWNGPYMWGASPALMQNSAAYKAAVIGDKDLKPGLRSTYDVEGRKISAPDTDFGHVVDFVIDDECWAIRYIIVDTINWWPSPFVLISPSRIDRIGMEDFKIYVNVPSETIKAAPEYKDEEELNRDYEECLNNHYGCDNYWDSQPCAKDTPEE
jgi:hypothetical protein